MWTSLTPLFYFSSQRNQTCLHLCTNNISVLDVPSNLGGLIITLFFVFHCKGDNPYCCFQDNQCS